MGIGGGGGGEEEGGEGGGVQPTPSTRCRGTAKVAQPCEAGQGTARLPYVHFRWRAQGDVVQVSQDTIAGRKGRDQGRNNQRLDNTQGKQGALLPALPPSTSPSLPPPPPHTALCPHNNFHAHPVGSGSAGTAIKLLRGLEETNCSVTRHHNESYPSHTLPARGEPPVPALGAKLDTKQPSVSHWAIDDTELDAVDENWRQAQHK